MLSFIVWFLLCSQIESSRLLKTVEEYAPKSNVCELPRDCGPCRGMMNRWFYNSNTKQCEQFEYGGCMGNENNFQSQRACKDACCSGDTADPQPGDICGSPPDDCDRALCPVGLCPDGVTTFGCAGECYLDEELSCGPVKPMSSCPPMIGDLCGSPPDDCAALRCPCRECPNGAGSYGCCGECYYNEYGVCSGSKSESSCPGSEEPAPIDCSVVRCAAPEPCPDPVTCEGCTNEDLTCCYETAEGECCQRRIFKVGDTDVTDECTNNAYPEICAIPTNYCNDVECIPCCKGCGGCLDEGIECTSMTPKGECCPVSTYTLNGEDITEQCNSNDPATICGTPDCANVACPVPCEGCRGCLDEGIECISMTPEGECCQVSVYILGGESGEDITEQCNANDPATMCGTLDCTDVICLPPCDGCRGCSDEGIVCSWVEPGDGECCPVSSYKLLGVDVTIQCDTNDPAESCDQPVIAPPDPPCIIPFVFNPYCCGGTQYSNPSEAACINIDVFDEGSMCQQGQCCGGLDDITCNNGLVGLFGEQTCVDIANDECDPDMGDTGCWGSCQIVEPVACTDDIFVCPDGQTVSRDPDNKCEFFPCPATITCANVLCTADSVGCFESAKGPTCCPETPLCKSEDFANNDPVTCGGVEYPNSCIAQCFDCCYLQCYVNPCDVQTCSCFPEAQCYGNCCGYAFLLTNGDGTVTDVTDRCNDKVEEKPTYPYECGKITCRRNHECCDDGNGFAKCCKSEDVCDRIDCPEGTKCCDESGVGVCREIEEVDDIEPVKCNQNRDCAYKYLCRPDPECTATMKGQGKGKAYGKKKQSDCGKVCIRSQRKSVCEDDSECDAPYVCSGAVWPHPGTCIDYQQNVY